MLQFFILEGMLKRVVSNPEGREMILRFAAETEMDTSYAAWRLRTPVPYSIVAVTKVRTAELPMPLWVDFLEKHTERQVALRVRGDEADVGGDGAHHHAAPAGCARAPVALPAQAPGARGRIPKKELAAYLNLTPETLSRLKQKLGDDCLAISQEISGQSEQEQRQAGHASRPACSRRTSTSRPATPASPGGTTASARSPSTIASTSGASG